MNAENDPKLTEINQLLSDAEKLWDKMKNLKPEELAAHPDSGDKSSFHTLYDLPDKLRELSETQVRTFIEDNKGVERISNLFLDTYSAYNNRGNDFRYNPVSKNLARSLEELAYQNPELTAKYLANTQFIEQSRDAINASLGQRDLFFFMAKNGPPNEKQPNDSYMNWAWYQQMAKDIEQMAGDKKIPPNLLPTENSPLDGKQLKYPYGNGGFEIGKTLALITSTDSLSPALEKQITDSQILERMFSYATHPSPVNGHVSLSSGMLNDLELIARRHPQLFADFIDVKDTALGQTPREFFAANSADRKNMPFLSLTDMKRGGEYYKSCLGLADALSGDLQKIEKIKEKIGKEDAGRALERQIKEQSHTLQERLGQYWKDKLPPINDEGIRQTAMGIAVKCSMKAIEHEMKEAKSENREPESSNVSTNIRRSLTNEISYEGKNKSPSKIALEALIKEDIGGRIDGFLTEETWRSLKDLQQLKTPKDDVQKPPQPQPSTNGHTSQVEKMSQEELLAVAGHAKPVDGYKATVGAVSLETDAIRSPTGVGAVAISTTRTV